MAWKEKTSDPSAEYKLKYDAYKKARAEWKMWHPTGVFTIADRPPEKVSRVSYNGCGISLHVYGDDGTYDIFTWERVDSLEKILWWVYHLSQKTWCDRLLIRDFIELTTARLPRKEVAK